MYTRKVVSCRLSDSDIKRLDHLCSRLEVNRSELLSRAITLYWHDYILDVSSV